jgi:excisionase family DNA binding protein
MASLLEKRLSCATLLATDFTGKGEKMERQDNLSERDHANIAVYQQKTLWNEAITSDYLTPQQVAELYHVSESAVYRWIRQGWIEADKVHGKNAKVGRYRISPLILDAMDKKRDMLIEESKRYWMRLYVHLGMKK